MTSPQVNKNIGMVTCAECDAPAAVRKSKAEKFYYDCLDCGRMTPNHSGGQDRLLKRAVIWGDQGAPPANAPRWIVEQWPYRRAMSDPQGQEPIGGGLDEPGKEKAKAKAPAAPPKTTRSTPRKPTPPQEETTPSTPVNKGAPVNGGSPGEAPEESPSGGFDFLD